MFCGVIPCFEPRRALKQRRAAVTTKLPFLSRSKLPQGQAQKHNFHAFRALGLGPRPVAA
jgi:hypothetical protein